MIIEPRQHATSDLIEPRPEPVMLLVVIESFVPEDETVRSLAVVCPSLVLFSASTLSAGLLWVHR